MKRIEMLLIQLMEECAEVQQAASKVLRFGPEDIHPVNKNLAKDNLNIEIHDFLALCHLLAKENILPDHIDKTVIEEKKKKIERYLLFSRECGTLE